MILSYALKRRNLFGYDVMQMNVEAGQIGFSCWKEWTEEDEAGLEDGESSPELTPGETLDASFAGRMYAFMGGSAVLLDDMRTHVKFSDMSCFGIDPTGEKPPMWADINPETRSDRAYPWLLSNNYLVKVLFPDTESTFIDAVITVPSSFAVEPFSVLCNLPMQAGGMGDESRNAMPSVMLSAPSSVSGGHAEIAVSVGANSMDLDSLYEITLETDNGYIARRRFAVAVGEAGHAVLDTAGLLPGDTVTVTAGVDGYRKAAQCRIAIRSSE